jgi:hypothetical protein
MEKAEIEKLYNQAKCRLDVNDPDLDCVTNLICYGFLLIKYADKSNRNQLVREFDEHCFKATNFFDGPAGQGNAPQDRVAIVKDGAAWVNSVKQWVITGLSGQLDPKEFEYLYDKQRELMARCKIMYTISMEKSKSSLLKEIKQAIEARKASGKVGETSGGKTGSRSIDSQDKHEDIVELKPNFCGIGLNINALIRKRKWGIKIKNLLKAFIYRILHNTSR